MEYVQKHLSCFAYTFLILTPLFPSTALGGQMLEYVQKHLCCFACWRNAVRTGYSFRDIRKKKFIFRL
jgi:hypothetical protein